MTGSSTIRVLAVNLAQTVFDLGGVAVNYMPVVSLIKEDDTDCWGGDPRF